MIEPSAEDAAFLTRLFGMRIPADDTSFRPALEWVCHVDMLKAAIPAEDAWERCGKPMVANLVGFCIWKGLGDRSPLGWSIEEVDDTICLGVLVMKQREAKVA